MTTPTPRSAAPGHSPTPSFTPTPTPAPGPGDFDFLAGHWNVSHRRLTKHFVSSNDWDEFTGDATCWTTLGGLGSIEELRVPARGFSGMGIRLFDLQKKIWSDYWVSSKFGILTPPSTGIFVEGIGTFESDDTFEGKPIRVRGVWDRITPTSCRWHQAASLDAGVTWEHNWFMDWTRA